MKKSQIMQSPIYQAIIDDAVENRDERLFKAASRQAYDILYAYKHTEIIADPEYERDSEHSQEAVNDSRGA